jgi:hypothetical protein
MSRQAVVVPRSSEELDGLRLRGTPPQPALPIVCAGPFSGGGQIEIMVSADPV